jgi:hypothetical protein
MRLLPWAALPRDREQITQLFCDAKTLKVYFEFFAKTFSTEGEIPVL